MDKRIKKMQELLANVMIGIQSLQIQATTTNIALLYDAMGSIQTVNNTLAIMQNEQQDRSKVVPMMSEKQEEIEDGREADPQ